MIPDIDIYRSARVIVKRHGEGAAIEAAMRADAMLDAWVGSWGRVTLGESGAETFHEPKTSE